MKKILKRLFIFSTILIGLLVTDKVSSAKVIEVNSTNFSDECVRKALKQYAINSDSNVDSDFQIDTDRITKLTIWSDSDDNTSRCRNLTGIELLTKLSSLTIWNFGGSSIYLSNNMLKSVHLVLFDDHEQHIRFKLPEVTDLSVQCGTGSKSIRSFDVSKCPKLQFLSLYDTQLKSIDISKNTKLSVLYLNDTQLKSIDISKNKQLKWLSLVRNQIKSIDISKNTKLEYVHIYATPMQSIDISKNTKLTTLQLGDNRLKFIDVSKNKQLSVLDLSCNQLKSIDVSKNSKLTSLACYETKISSLNLKKNKKLQSISIYKTQINKLDLTKYNKLSLIYKVKLGSTINLTPYLGKGYNCVKNTTSLVYDNSKNTIKTKGEGYRLELILINGKKQYNIIVTVTS